MDRTASKTAVMIAGYRARASEREGALFRDPWAKVLAGEEGKNLADAWDRIFPFMELWVAIRTAYFDRFVRTFTSSRYGMTQVVGLGAGLDTRAARLAAEGVRFFEVDHPLTQTEKRERLRTAKDYPTNATTYVPCDFERDEFLGQLKKEGFRTDVPALFVWEGVTPYLQEPSVRSTLRTIAEGCHPNTVVAFDHLLKKIIDARKAPRDEATSKFVNSVGEPFVWGTNDSLPMLYEEGFRHVRSLSFDEACLTLTGTYARENEFRFQRLVLASRVPADWGF